MECVGLDDFPASGATVIRRDPQTDDTKPAHKALNELMLDCFKKIWESRGKHKRAAAREALVVEVGQVKDEEGADAEGRAPNKRSRYYDGRPVVIYILDPEDAVHHPQPRVWNWNVGGVKKLGVLYEASLNELHIKVSSQLPNG
ncbi:hypothetical protein L211DRAFT_853703 [Terfezia boudieri ATCC MYA-4762]|uniref:Uncharacterized protein n=1 Tax=Terfezia boudieri ATCC MYA-4762 TaxID=1051890 RepID=A0A3N4L7L5_9PEZI|nr:hypothetical protein L211DRAFT_853703 [Terfezia boudieri ATCC MYA-4762]